MTEHESASAKLLASFRDEFELDESHIRALELAGEHLDAADLLDNAVIEHGTMIPGSSKQLVVNPAIAEARQQRSAAWSILRNLVPDDASGNDDAASLGQAAEGSAVRSSASQRASKAAQVRWDRARAARNSG